MNPGRRNTVRVLILVRYAMIVVGSVWWLLTTLGRPPGRSILVVPLALLVGSILFNVSLDLIDRFSSPTSALRVLLHHQILFDLIAMNTFVGAMGSPLLMGRPVFYGGRACCPSIAAL